MLIEEKLLTHDNNLNADRNANMLVFRSKILENLIPRVAIVNHSNMYTISSDANHFESNVHSKKKTMSVDLFWVIMKLILLHGPLPSSIQTPYDGGRIKTI